MQSNKRRAGALLSGLCILVAASCATTPAASPPALSANASARNEAVSRLAAMEEIFRYGVDHKVASGFSAALTDASGMTQTTFVGLADIETSRPIDANSVFRLYSMTKPITAVAIMMLVEDGKIDLDVPLSTYIPSFANSVVYVSGDTLATLKTEPLARPLTVRDLMRQSAGMPYFGADKPVERLYAFNGIERAPGEPVPGASDPRVASLADLADRIARTPLVHQPGASYTYGNAIDVLGRVVEVASGQSLGGFFKARIFTPLGMTHTGFQVQPGDVDNLANAYFAVVQPPQGEAFSTIATLADVPPHGELRPADPPAKSILQGPARLEFGGSGLVGTLGDYVKFAQMIARRGEFGGVRLLKASSVLEMGKDQLGPQASSGIAKYGYSYGLGFGRIMDPAISKTGAPIGTMYWSGAAGSYFWADPNTRKSGVIMTNVFNPYLGVYQRAAARAAHGETAK